MSQKRKFDLRSFYVRVARRARHRCEYCHAPENFFNHRLSLNHIDPESHGGLTALENLALSCFGCQQQKLTFASAIDPTSKAIIRLFHPRRQKWSRHFRWSPDGLHLEGLTRAGRATIDRLALNNPRQIEARKRWRSHPDLFP